MNIAIALLLCAQELEEPRLILDWKEPINVDIGHAAPAMFDVDGDGKRDLVVGQFKDGHARIYINKGTDREPRFEGFSWLEAGGKRASVPAG